VGPHPKARRFKQPTKGRWRDRLLSRRRRIALEFGAVRRGTAQEPIPLVEGADDGGAVGIRSRGVQSALDLQCRAELCHSRMEHIANRDVHDPRFS